MQLPVGGGSRQISNSAYTTAGSRHANSVHPAGIGLRSGKQQTQLAVPCVGQTKQALQVDDRRRPEMLETALGWTQVGCVAQPVAHQFSLLAFDPAPSPVERPEFIRFLTGTGLAQERFIGSDVHCSPLVLAVDAAGK